MVRVNDRKTSPRQFSKDSMDLFEMIDHDLNKLHHKAFVYIFSRIRTITTKYNEYMYAYNSIYPNKSHPENGLRRNIYIVLMNEKLIELFRALLPLIMETPKIKKPRILTYTKMINHIIVLNSNNFKRDIAMNEELFAKIDEFTEYEKAKCKEIMENPDYTFEYAPHYVKANMEKAQFVNAAMKLYKYTFSKVKRLPETRRILYGENLLMIATDIFYSCYDANTIYPLCQEDFEMREEKLNHAIRLLAQFSRALNQFKMREFVSDQVFNHWTRKYMDCKLLVEGIQKSDKKRFKNLPPKAEIENYEELRKDVYMKMVGVTEEYI